MNKKELFEAIPFQIVEQQEVTENGQRRLRVKGVFHRANERNLNNRIYPTSIIERETKKMNDRIAKTETVFMQADHPQDGVSRIGDTTAILRNVSFNPQTNEVMGEADIIATRKGEDLAQIIKAGGRIGISARGFGTTKPGEVAGSKGDVVQEDYQLVTYDFVVGQSTRGAVVTNFAEQARLLAGLQGEDMDLKELDIEKLNAARPDLVTALQEKANADAKKSLDEATAALTAKEEAFKKKTAAADAEDAKDGGDDEDTEDANGKKKKYEQLQLEAEKLGFKLVKKDEKTVQTESELANVKKQLTEAMDSFKKLEETQQSLVEKSEAVETHKYILDKTKGEKKFQNALVKRLLESCKTKKDVDDKFDGVKSDILALLQEVSGGSGSGSGVTAKEEEKGDVTGEKTFKTKDGKVLTEMQIRTRTLSGIKTELSE